MTLPAAEIEVAKSSSTVPRVALGKPMAMGLAPILRPVPFSGTTTERGPPMQPSQIIDAMPASAPISA